MVSSRKLESERAQIFESRRAHNKRNFSRKARMSGERPQFVLFGDSITQMAFASPDGWAAKLADDYTARVDVFNRGFSGYNTRWLVFFFF